MITKMFNPPSRRSASSTSPPTTTTVLSKTAVNQKKDNGNQPSSSTTATATGVVTSKTKQHKENVKQKRDKEELLHGKEEVIHIDVEQQNRYSSRNNVVLDEGDVKTVVFKLSNTERSFLPREVQRRLANRAGQLPPSPSIYPGYGAALFVDISGFTALGDYLRKTCKTPKEAANLLAQRITHVISLLTKVCLNFNGDVAKFAGDAILCIWDDEGNTTRNTIVGGGINGNNNNSNNSSSNGNNNSGGNGILSRSNNYEDVLNQAKACALEMLHEIERFNQSTNNSNTGTDNEISLADHKLQIHGGIAVGSILHFHLGSLDDKLRSYLVAGEAVFGATEVVSMAGPGEFVVIKDRLYGTQSRSSQLSLATLTVGRGSDLGQRQRRSRKSGKMKLSPAIGGSRASIGLSPTMLAEMQKNAATRAGEGGEERSASTSTSPSVKSDDHHFSGEYTGLATITEGDDDVHPRESNLVVARSRAGTLRRASNLANSSTLSRLAAASSSFFSKSGRFLTFGTGENSQDGQQMQPQQPVHVAPTLPENLVYDKLTIKTILNSVKTRGRVRTESDPSLRDGIPRNGNVYIPKALRKGLRTGFSPSEMRDRVAIVFVGLEDLSLSEPEIQQNQINDEKLDLLNSAFVKMTRITHSFDGEVRDLLFDDKGCVFISVFGALSPLEHPGLNAVKSAIAIMNEIKHARAGISMGTVFVGMCGNPKRQDFVVMGHEVNMSARYMSNADPGTIIVSPIIYENAKDVIKFTEETVYFGKASTEDPDGMDVTAPDGTVKRLKKHKVYKPDMGIISRPSFLAQYKYAQVDKDLFIGRMTELHRIEVLLANNMGLDPLTIGDTGAPSGRASFTTGGQNAKKRNTKPGTVVIIESSSIGAGKSALVSRTKKLGKGRIKIVAGRANNPHHDTDEFSPIAPLSAFSQALEAFTGLHSGLEKHEVLNILDLYTDRSLNTEQNPNAGKLDKDALSFIFPWLDSVGSSSFNEYGDRIPETDEDITKIKNVITQIIKFGLNTNGFLGSKGILLILEDIHNMDIWSLRLLKSFLDEVPKLRGFVLLLTYRTKDDSRSSSSGSGSNGSGRLHVSFSYAPPPSAIIEQEFELVITHAQSIAIRGGLHLKLQGLSREDADLFVTRNFASSDNSSTMFGVGQIATVDKAILDKVYAITNGYPLHLKLLVQWIKERQLIEMKRAGSFGTSQGSSPKELPPPTWVWKENVVKDVTFPSTITEVILARFDILFDETTKSILRVCSTFGMNEFTPTFVLEVMKTWQRKQSLGFLSRSKLNMANVIDALQQAHKNTFIRRVASKDASSTITEEDQFWKWRHDVFPSSIVTLLSESQTKKIIEIVKNRAESEIELNRTYKPSVASLGDQDRGGGGSGYPKARNKRDPSREGGVSNPKFSIDETDNEYDDDDAYESDIGGGGITAVGSGTSGEVADVPMDAVEEGNEEKADGNHQ